MGEVYRHWQRPRREWRKERRNGEMGEWEMHATLPLFLSASSRPRVGGVAASFIPLLSHS